MMDWYQTTILKKRPLTKNAVSLVIERPEGFHWKAGQFINIRLDNSETVRSYSIANTTDDDFIELGIKLKAGGVMSPILVNQTSSGDRLFISKADGRFVLLPDESRRMQHVFIAAGSGITPILGMIRESLEKEALSDVVLWYGSRSLKEQMFSEALDRIKEKYASQFQYYPAYSTKTLRSFFGKKNLLQGRIDKQKIAIILKSLDNRLASKFYICGPDKMIEDVRNILLSQDIHESQILVEFFVANKLDSGQQGIIHVEGDKDLNVPISSKQSILDALLAQNLDVNFGCRNGGCGSCKMILKEGEVKMIRDFALTKEEKEQNYILGCQATCVSKEITVQI